MRFVQFLAAILLISAVSFSGTPAKAATVYDSNVENRLGLSSGQRSKVVRIVRASRRERNKILRKYKIDPKGTPDLRRLSFAGRELRELGKSERGKLQKILSEKQLKKYDEIIAETRKRIIEASKKKN